MNDYDSLNHTKWECKYHVVFIPKYRRKALFRSGSASVGRAEPATTRPTAAKRIGC